MADNAVVIRGPGAGLIAGGALLAGELFAARDQIAGAFNAGRDLADGIAGAADAIRHYLGTDNQVGGPVSSGPLPLESPPMKRARIEEADSAESIDSDATVPMVNGQPDGNTPGTGHVIPIAPERIYPTSPIRTKKYRKVNRFIVNVNEHPTRFVPENGFSPYLNACHAVPWRASAMYMNEAEYKFLQYQSTKYRYKSCSVKFSNFATHSGNLAGSTDPHISINYGGIMAYAGMVNSEDFGPYYFTNKDGNPVNQELIYMQFASPRRSRDYNAYPIHCTILPRVVGTRNGADQSVNPDQFVSQWSEPLDWCAQNIGNLPITEFSVNMTDRRWRNSMVTTNVMSLRTHGVSGARPVGGELDLSSHKLYGYGKPHNILADTGEYDWAKTSDDIRKNVI